MSNTGGKGFFQAVRTTKVSECDLMDPLSMFAMQDKMDEPVPVVIQQSHRSHQSKSQPKIGSLTESFKEEPSVNSTPRKSESRGSLRSVSPAPVPPKQVVPPKPPTVQQVVDEENMLRYLTGEQKIMSILDSFVTTATGEVVSGTLFMTNYRLIFIPSPADLTSITINNPSLHSWLQIPIAAIDKIDREKRSKDLYVSAVTITIHCKDFRQIRFTIRNSSNKMGSSDFEIERAVSLITAYAFPNNMRYLFAFTHKLSGIQVNDLAEPYDPALEFSRLGVLDNPLWRVSNANASYQLCNTYPQWLVVPAAITDEELHQISNFRSGHRLPAMCWADRESGATMWRCSQPKAGVSGSCSQDERMLDIIARSCATHNLRKRADPNKKHYHETILYIVDCRSRASAMANRAAGAGYESQTNYPNTRLDFYSITNIHAVRDMYKSLSSFLLTASPNSSIDLTFTKQFEDSLWLNSIRSILKASYDTAVYLNNGAPVLVHCSHGWDRTAQVCAIAQLLLDPYYRTFEGFKVLIEKEWNSFGHAFQMRCGHSQDKVTRQDDQISQIFVQFLDCIWQIHHQCIQYFEFNARYILLIADHVYSGRFGTFLFSSDYERDLYDARNTCPDIWTYLNCNRQVLSNPLYTNPERVILPPLSQLLRNVTIWSDYFLRWSSAPTVAPIPLQLSQHLYVDGLCRPLHKDELHEQPYEPLDTHGAPLSALADFEVSAAVTSEDCWEAAYRSERVKRINVEVRKQKVITQQQESINLLLQLLRENAPQVSEDVLALALQPQSAASLQSLSMSAASTEQTPTSELDTLRVAHSVELSGKGVSKSNIAAVHSQEEEDTASVHSQELTERTSTSCGIVINEKYQDLFITPPLNTVSQHSLSQDNLHQSDSSPLDTPHMHPSADDASFFPEDEDDIGGVSV